MEYIKKYIISFKRGKKKNINDFILGEIHLLKRTRNVIKYPLCSTLSEKFFAIDETSNCTSNKFQLCQTSKIFCNK